jgi:hypothetical protein
MIGTARTLDADAASAYLNGLISYEQSGRLVHPTTERIAAPAQISNATDTAKHRPGIVCCRLVGAGSERNRLS